MTKQFSKERGQERKTFLMRFFYHAKQRKAGTRGLKLDLCEINIFFSFHQQYSEKTQLFNRIWRTSGKYLDTEKSG